MDPKEWEEWKKTVRMFMQLYGLDETKLRLVDHPSKINRDEAWHVLPWEGESDSVRVAVPTIKEQAAFYAYLKTFRLEIPEGYDYDFMLPVYNPGYSLEVLRLLVQFLHDKQINP